MAGEYLEVRVEGLKELAAELRDFPDRLARKVLRGATAACAAAIRDEARLRAPVMTGPAEQGHPPPGTLRRSIIIKQIPEKSSALQQTFYLTVRHGKKYAKQGRKGTLSQDAYYAKWVEYGHWINPGKALGGTNKDRQRAARIAGGQNKFVAARPYMRPAFEAKKAEALATFQEYLAQRIAKEVQTLPRFRLLWKA